MNQPGVFKLTAQGLAPGAAKEAGMEAGRAADEHQHTLPQDDGRAARAAAAGRAGAGPAAGSAAHRGVRTAFVPLLLMALALLGGFAAQLFEGYQQRQSLLAAHASQQQTVDNAGKLRQSLDALAADTQRMADAGNANAALLVTELRKRGITITVPGAATAPEAAAQPSR